MSAVEDIAEVISEVRVDEDPVDTLYGLDWDTCMTIARAVEGALKEKGWIQRGVIGAHVEDGGQWGTIVRCSECDGQGVLHRLDHSIVETPVEPSAGVPA